MDKGTVIHAGGGTHAGRNFLVGADVEGNTISSLLNIFDGLHVVGVEGSIATNGKSVL